LATFVGRGISAFFIHKMEIDLACNSLADLLKIAFGILGMPMYDCFSLPFSFVSFSCSPGCGDRVVGLLEGKTKALFERF